MSIGQRGVCSGVSHLFKKYPSLFVQVQKNISIALIYENRYFKKYKRCIKGRMRGHKNRRLLFLCTYSHNFTVGQCFVCDLSHFPISNMTF